MLHKGSVFEEMFYLIILIILIVVWARKSTNSKARKRRKSFKVIDSNTNEIVRHKHYQDVSGNGFLRTFFNKGNYGEYLIYSELSQMQGYHRLLTNLYIPMKNGRKTEIDVVMISRAGIFVFESRESIYDYYLLSEIRDKLGTLSDKELPFR